MTTLDWKGQVARRRSKPRAEKQNRKLVETNPTSGLIRERVWCLAAIGLFAVSFLIGHVAPQYLNRATAPCERDLWGARVSRARPVFKRLRVNHLEVVDHSLFTGPFQSRVVDWKGPVDKEVGLCAIAVSSYETPDRYLDLY